MAANSDAFVWMQCRFVTECVSSAAVGQPGVSRDAVGPQEAQVLWAIDPDDQRKEHEYSQHRIPQAGRDKHHRNMGGVDERKSISLDCIFVQRKQHGIFNMVSRYL